MRSSRTLVAPGLRTAPRGGWRNSVATALGVAVSNPSLWLLGAVGFAARGGIIALLLVIVVLPTPVEVRALLGEYLSSSGLTAAFYAQLLPVAVALALLVAAALVVAAQTELSAFERFVSDPESLAERDGRVAMTIVDRHRGLLTRLFLVQLAAAAALVIAAAPFAFSLYGATTQELTRPTPGGASLYLRVLFAVRDPLFLLLPAIVLIDMFAATASRQLMLGHLGLGAPAGRMRRSVGATLNAVLLAPLRRPLSSIGTSSLVWLTSLIVLAPLVWALDIAWDATRAAFLGQRPGADPQAVAWLVVISVVFAAIWSAAVLLAGFASAVRASLWSAEALR